MKLFNEFITENTKPATSMDDEQLGHLTHAKDLPHEDPKHAKEAISLLHEFHRMRQGQVSHIGASLKTDGGASVHIIHDQHGIAVSDKHRFKRGVVARTPKEIDQHFGHAPEYAAALKHILKHGKEFVNPGHHVQGDLLFTPDEKHTKTGSHVETTPNRITYKAKTKAHTGIAIHTELHNGVAHAISPHALKQSNHVFVPEPKYKADPKTYSEKDREAVQHHLNAAREILKDHKDDHLDASHKKHFTIFMNRSTKNDTKPTIEGYMKHLAAEGEKAASKLKSEAGRNKKKAEYEELQKHVDKNSEHFNKSIQLRHHLEQATEHLLKGVEHPDMETSIDGKKSQGEGIVLQKGNRPVAKLVPKKVSHAILNNTRFAKSS
jgi:hypothetical protein